MLLTERLPERASDDLLALQLISFSDLCSEACRNARQIVRRDEITENQRSFRSAGDKTRSDRGQGPSPEAAKREKRHENSFRTIPVARQFRGETDMARQEALKALDEEAKAAEVSKTSSNENNLKKP